jgi:hypothetical protein
MDVCVGGNSRQQAAAAWRDAAEMGIARLLLADWRGDGCRTSSGEVTRFSTASTTPCSVRTAIAVDPSCAQRRGGGGCGVGGCDRGAVGRVRRSATPRAGRALALMASIAYSTWNRRPSGLKVLTPLRSGRWIE